MVDGRLQRGIRIEGLGRAADNALQAEELTVRRTSPVAHLYILPSSRRMNPPTQCGVAMSHFTMTPPSLSLALSISGGSQMTETVDSIYNRSAVGYFNNLRVPAAGEPPETTTHMVFAHSRLAFQSFDEHHLQGDVRTPKHAPCGYEELGQCEWS